MSETRALAKTFDFDKIAEEETPQAMRLADILFEVYHPKSVVDAGCATGLYLEGFLNRHVDVHGYDIHPDAIERSVIPAPLIELSDISDPSLAVQRRDLGLCLEVLEHIDESKADAAVKNLCRMARVLVVSAAHPDQGGTGHINCQPKEYWVTKFENNGYRLDDADTQLVVDKVKQGPHMGWLPMNLMVFKPASVELHWVNTGTEFPLPYFLAIQSSLKTQKAAKFNLWLVKEPSGKYFDAIKDKVTIRHLDEPVPDFAALQGKDDVFKAAHLVDYYRLKILLENGGVYADLDSLSIGDYCTFAGERLAEGKEFVAALVSTPHVYHGGLWACTKGSELVKTMLDECCARLNNAVDFKWGNSGPDIINKVCNDNLDKIAEAEYAILGGNIELYEIYRAEGKLPENQRYVHLWANSCNGYWTNITEDYIETSDHLYAKMVRNCLTKEERHPFETPRLGPWLFAQRTRYIPLFDLLKTRDCFNIMEIGVFDGRNAVLMIKAAGKRVTEDKIHYYGFDLFDKLTPEMAEMEYNHLPVPLMEAVEKYIKENTTAAIHLYQGKTKETLSHNLKALPKMDIIFIDGGHSIETIRKDWWYAHQLMKSDTVVVFDDYYPEVPFIGCRFLLTDLDAKYQSEIMPETDVHQAPWGQLKVQMLCVRQKSLIPGPIRPVSKPVLHVLGLAHTQTTKEFSACAYTQKVFKFCGMMKKLGYEVIHYGAEGSNPDCTENVEVLSTAVQHECYGDYDWKTQQFRHDPKDLAYTTFNKNAIVEINKRKEPRDILCITMGNYQLPIVKGVGLWGSVESGIGYSGVFTDKRIFESYAWMHFIYGVLANGDAKGGCVNPSYFDAVIPNYFHQNDFEFSDKKENWYLFMGRLIENKGLRVAYQCCEKIGKKLVIAGQGTSKELEAFGIDPKKAEFVGYADYETRKELLKKAKAVFVPTQYLGPFEGVAIEANFSGTPCITTDFGVFNETVQHGKTGFRCHSMDDFVFAANHVGDLDYKYIRDYAVNNYSVDKVGLMFDEYFLKLQDVWGKGFYQEHPERKSLSWLERWY